MSDLLTHKLLEIRQHTNSQRAELVSNVPGKAIAVLARHHQLKPLRVLPNNATNWFAYAPTIRLSHDHR